MSALTADNQAHTSTFQAIIYSMETCALNNARGDGIAGDQDLIVLHADQARIEVVRDSCHPAASSSAPLAHSRRMRAQGRLEALILRRFRRIPRGRDNLVNKSTATPKGCRDPCLNGRGEPIAICNRVTFP